METLKIAIEFASWPIVVLTVFFFLRSPISKLLGKIRFIKNSGIEVTFVDDLLRQGFSKSQLVAIESLTEADLDLYLLVSYSDAPEFKYQIPVQSSEEHASSFARLEKAGLMRVTTKSEEGLPALHLSTPAGRRVRSLVIRSTVDLLRSGNEA